MAPPQPVNSWGDWCARPKNWNECGTALTNPRFESCNQRILVDPFAIWNDTLTAEDLSDNKALKPNNAGRRRMQTEDEIAMANEAAMDAKQLKLESEKASDILPPTYFNITTTNQTMSQMRQQVNISWIRPFNASSRDDMTLFSMNETNTY